SVQEQNNVWNDVILSTQNSYLKLANRDEAIIVPVREVDEADSRAFLSRLAVLADACVFQQELQYVPVVLDEAGSGEICRQLLDHFLNLVVLQPGIDYLQLLPQHGQHDDFRESLAERIFRFLLLVAVDDLPAQARQLIQEGLLDVIPLVELEFLGEFFVHRHQTASTARCGDGSSNAVTRFFPVRRSWIRPVFRRRNFLSSACK